MRGVNHCVFTTDLIHGNRYFEGRFDSLDYVKIRQRLDHYHVGTFVQVLCSLMQSFIAIDGSI